MHLQVARVLPVRRPPAERAQAAVLLDRVRRHLAGLGLLGRVQEPPVTGQREPGRVRCLGDRAQGPVFEERDAFAAAGLVGVAADVRPHARLPSSYRHSSSELGARTNPDRSIT
jgi:hypothetical protein